MKAVSVTSDGVYIKSSIIFELFEQDTLLSAKYAQRAIKKSDHFIRSAAGDFIHQYSINNKVEQCLLYRG